MTQMIKTSQLAPVWHATGALISFSRSCRQAIAIWFAAVTRFCIPTAIHQPDEDRNPVYPPGLGFFDLADSNYPKYRREALAHDPHCAYCGTKVGRQGYGLDHLIPRSRGGRNQPVNLVLACDKCNTAKGDDTPEEYRQRLLVQIRTLQATADQCVTLQRRVSSIPVRPRKPSSIVVKRVAGSTSEQGGNTELCWDLTNFKRSRYRFSLVDATTGRPFLRNLRISEAVHVLQELGAGQVELQWSTSLYSDELGLTPTDETTRLVPMKQP